MVSREGVWSWSNLDQATNRLAAPYLALELQPGDRVASLMPNRTALFVHYLACFKAGLVLTPLNYRYTPPEIDHALDVSAARIILAHAERAEDIAASKASSLPLGVILYGDESGKGLSFEALLKAEAPGGGSTRARSRCAGRHLFHLRLDRPGQGRYPYPRIARLDLCQRRLGVRIDAARRVAAGLVMLPYRRLWLFLFGPVGRRPRGRRQRLRS